MAIHVALSHRTTYRYDRKISLGPQIIRLRPAPHCRTPILSYSLKVAPGEQFLNWQQDPFSNYLARLVFPEKSDIFEVEVEVVAEMAVYNPFDFFLEKAAEEYPFSYDPAVAHDLAPYLKTSSHGDLFTAFFKSIDRTTEVRTIDFLVGLNQRLNDEIDYLIRMEPGVQTPDETLEKKRGSCRDSAWLLCELFRHCGIASRFVSGYLIQLKPDVKSLDGPSGTEVDFTDLHAWTEVYLPGAGWVGLDPTSGLLAGEGHIPLACTPEPSSAAPISGATEKADCEFDFAMSVSRIYESPRVTKPYSEEEWERITALGDSVDERLTAGDVRLTMGGEPTFVSIDDMEGDEWNSVAHSPAKRKIGAELVRRLRKRFAPGGFLHFGQGKWYPGEQLPRWAYGCFWRKDGVPMWEDIDLVAEDDKDYGFGPKDSAKFIGALCDRLDVDSRWIMPAYEDAWYFLWKERRLPSNVDPLKSNLKDKEERDRLARVFEQGLNKVVGHVLPLKRDHATAGDSWQSGPWFLRPETLYLIPGDSPLGYRLPLDSLPWVAETDYPWIYEPDPHRPLVGDLPGRPQKDGQAYLRSGVAADHRAFVEGGHPPEPPNSPGRTARPAPTPRSPMPPDATGSTTPRSASAPSGTTPAESQPQPAESAPWIVRTSMAVEAREGRLYVFMPPTEELEDYLHLLALVEETAAHLRMPILVEGYPPPHDPRVDVLKVTPDPGVIEVNVQPATSWREMIEITTGIYEDAHHSRLGTEKFMIDGRHSGTGGGNHIVVGGDTPADSPLLRRPHLLRSLVNYWQNHPSLSYLFSGLFIGPTSQSPRIDEARNDALAELEIAFDQIPDHGDVPPWLVDRVFRNLLTDVTGNVHRSEFCIDKMFAPEGAAGRLGLLELRAFEMPPHARMSLAQQLLLRALIARFWDAPYRQPLVRWGTELHDRFMLPHFVWQDFGDIINDLTDSGFAFEKEWFAPHLEFRFPIVGARSYRETTLELRTALEPWHVLGEEGIIGGTVRYVDSSLERLQLKATGLVGDRYDLLCNGVQLPLAPTGTAGEYVAGIRYRAWQPPECLQPTIGVHAPLTIDLFDRYTGKSVAGCVYHVSHPGGRSHETFPVNSYEAESRRLSRFSPHGHTGGLIDPKKVPPHPGHPFTLDLREHLPGVIPEPDQD